MVPVMMFSMMRMMRKMEGVYNRPPFNGGWDPAGTANAILAVRLRPGMGAEVLETMRRNVRARH